MAIEPAMLPVQVDLDKFPSGIVPQLQNVVATVSLGCTLELKNIALQARNSEYNPKRFAAVIMRIREPKTTALIFKSGKMVHTRSPSCPHLHAELLLAAAMPTKCSSVFAQVVTGAKSEEEARNASRKYADPANECRCCGVTL